MGKKIKKSRKPKTVQRKKNIVARWHEIKELKEKLSFMQGKIDDLRSIEDPDSDNMVDLAVAYARFAKVYEDLGQLRKAWESIFTIDLRNTAYADLEDVGFKEVVEEYAELAPLPGNAPKEPPRKPKNPDKKVSPKMQRWLDVTYDPNSYLRYSCGKKLNSGPQNLPGKWRETSIEQPEPEEPADNEREVELRGELEQAKSAELDSCQSLLEVVELFELYCGPNVELAEDAKRSAKHYKKFERFDMAWEMLCSIVLELYTVKFSEDLNDIEGEFNRRVASFEYARSEGPMSKTTRIARIRKLQHKGKSYEIWPHIKWGRHEPEMLRIHLAYDEDCQKIIVGYIGPHMRNRSSLSHTH